MSDTSASSAAGSAAAGSGSVEGSTPDGPAERAAGERPGAERAAGERPNWWRRGWQRGRCWSHRTRALIIGCVLALALLVAGTTIPMPYVALGPGSTFNTVGEGQGREVITFSGADIPAAASQQPAGHLNMLTIRVVDQVPLLEGLGMWISGRYKFAPREEYFPPGKTKQQVNEENVKMFRDSQSAAEIEALRYLHYPNVVYVGTITKGSPSWDVLEPDDRITAVNGTAVSDFASLQAVMKTTKPGERVTVTVERDGAPVTRTITLEANKDQGPQGFLGIGIVERPQAPFTISISLEDIGGPSAGLMFTLGIIDRLTPGDLSGGQFIAGTGTMGLDGTVGPIGGVTFKEVTARDAGADYMLVPEENCAEAKTAVPDGLTLVKVHTLDGALAAVRTIASGGTPPAC